MPVVLVQACQGSYAPAWAIGTVRHVGRRYGRTNVLPARALFVGKPQLEAGARHSAVKTDKNGAFRYSKKAAPFLSLASAARS
jgi:hypothetical protein